jgi:hypothetical protein
MMVFWELAAESFSRDGVEEGTMFGFACVRLSGSFIAMPGNTSVWSSSCPPLVWPS